MEDLLLKTSLQRPGHSKKGKGGKKGRRAAAAAGGGGGGGDERLFRDIEAALGVIERLKADPDDVAALGELDAHVKAILSLSNANADTGTPAQEEEQRGEAKKEL